MGQPAPQPALYVAPDGSDAWSGRLPRPKREGTDGPVATLARARDLVRPLRASLGARRLIVEIAPGEYFLQEPLRFGPEDSGTPGGEEGAAA